MKKLISILVISLFVACKPSAKTEPETTQDSITKASDQKVENIIQNDDSLIKAKEKELLEKYK